MPPDGDLAAFGATWLGWDLRHGAAAAQPDIAALEEVTRTPRKYGFHGTLKPPFRLRDGVTRAALEQAVEALAACTAPADCAGLDLKALGRFLALTPQGDQSGLARVAAACVTELDPLRAPATEAELTRRRQARLSDRQDALLQQWGYPYVLDQFRFHLTLTGRLPVDRVTHWMDVVRAHLPDLPVPFGIHQVALVGERSDGRFELLHRYTLSGSSADSAAATV